MNTSKIFKQSLLAAVSASLLFASASASAHGDGRAGPVIKAAQQALDTDNVNRVLMWVQPADEAEIKEAFLRVRAVRSLYPLAKEFADNYFSETLVRMHRASEGAATRKVEPEVDLLAEHMRQAIAAQFREVVAVAAERRY